MSLIYTQLGKDEKLVIWTRVKTTGENVLQGKVHTPATHLSKDTWQLTSGNRGTGWKKKAIHVQLLLGKVIFKPMS